MVDRVEADLLNREQVNMPACFQLLYCLETDFRVILEFAVLGNLLLDDMACFHASEALFFDFLDFTWVDDLCCFVVSASCEVHCWLFLN